MSTTWPHAPVAVLGAGPVGQTTALLLARWGVPAIVLDQRPARDRVGSKAICQQRDVLDIWDAVGAGAQIAAEGVTWTTARTFHRDAELFATEFAEAGRPAFPPFVNISQTRTEEILDERIAAEPLVEVRWGNRVVHVDHDGSGVEVRLEDGGRLRAPYLVVCGGARSDQLRELLGVGFDGHSFDDRFLICDVRADLPGWATERRFYFDPEWNPGRQVLIHPCPDSTFRVDWQVPSDYDLDAEVASGALDARIRKIVGHRDYEIVWKSVYRFHSRVVDRMRIGRVLVAGDAAHLVSPFGARGLNSGVADAENAAWKIAWVGYGWSPDALLESYHDERHAAAVENITVTTATMDFLVPQDESQARYRADVLAAAAHDADSRTRVDSGRLAEPFWYAESRLTTAAAHRTFAGRPPRGQLPPAGPGVLLPDAPVARPDGTTGQVRTLARDGFLLLTAHGVDLDAVRAATRALPGPVRVLALTDLDPHGTLADALDVRRGEVWVVRPDAHVAATLIDPAIDDIVAALQRAAAHTAPQEDDRHGVLHASR
ncbi:MAG: FAD-dependent monooxygenase [Pseudonocardia sp.]|uniref:FAD-dependent monooxygenase n=1 Tax=unclassified Pseudonocardia TaxID=2619320 RepID=UPI00086B6D9E|nr:MULTISPECIES: FAD-dependent monooxygenase [unclassified Pseudonocardia]MBN9107156.1 FAD-dependent monooxygenase [Pseudonocardia sp.]ODU26361.1 MAG: pentachlorophenol monooxygenase [Pseudonocardia sp. SCN 72-51]ODV02711.1 MAG: pentachlorophenol monooxygenase [Pseudonocardia sp. SCN 73-27]